MDENKRNSASVNYTSLTCTVSIRNLLISDQYGREVVVLSDPRFVMKLIFAYWITEL
jgi:hypothetical protein